MTYPPSTEPLTREQRIGLWRIEAAEMQRKGEAKQAANPERCTESCPGCGHPILASDDPFPLDATGCIWCPPAPCEKCGEPESFDTPCSCHLVMTGLAFADIKAIFAASDMGLELPKPEAAA